LRQTSLGDSLATTGIGYLEKPADADQVLIALGLRKL
jgi:ActR/RegA family two-component response regulator